MEKYAHQPFSEIPIFIPKRYVEKLYVVGGLAGEVIRGYYHYPPQNFIRAQIDELTRPYSRTLSNKLADSIKKVLKSVFDKVCDKYSIEDKNSEDIPQYMYQETRCRHHYGKGSVCPYFGNDFYLSPIIDPTVQTVRLSTDECPDPRLLIAFLFARYEPDLLNFPYEDKRSIAPETIEYAKKINARFPYVKNDRLSISRGGGSAYCRMIIKWSVLSPTDATIRTSQENFRKVA